MADNPGNPGQLRAGGAPSGGEGGAPPDRALRPGDLHVCSASLDLPAAEVLSLRHLLSADERARADRFRFERDRSRYTVGRAILRILLGGYLGLSPGRLTFTYGEFQKPRLVDDQVWFNLSHSGAIALFAFTTLGEVGIDVERNDADFSRELIAERFFSPAEVRELRSLHPALQPLGFLTCWTRKEAFIKARGDGLSLALDSFDVSLRPGSPAALYRTAWSDDEPGRWCLEDLSDHEQGYVAAVAVRSEGWQLVRRRLGNEIHNYSFKMTGGGMSAEQTGGPGGLRGMRRKAVQTTNLVQTGFLPGGEGKLPLVVTPAVDNVDLVAWCANNKEQLDGWFDKYGAILFRGFGLETASDFEAVASGIASDLFAEYGDLPPEAASERIYGSTPYPPDKMILFHNESSHLPSWPLRQFFFCVTPSRDRGETPLIDCRTICEALDPALLEEFERKGLMYVRNFSEGIDVPWQDFFHTDDKASVEQTCSDAGMSCEWTSQGLRIRQLARAVRTHPRTGERLFFNQIQLHHVHCLDNETRSALRQLFADEDMPRNVYFGDGTPIPDQVVDQIGELFEELCVEFPWQKGDLIAVDNMIVSHARRPFSGERKLLVAMGQMVEAKELAAV